MQQINAQKEQNRQQALVYLNHYTRQLMLHFNLSSKDMQKVLNCANKNLKEKFWKKWLCVVKSFLHPK